MSGVLDNFLSSFTSRYSDFEGYWLFGFLVIDLEEMRFNLLSPTPIELSSVIEKVHQIATVKFDDQTRKAGLLSSQVCEAWLSIRRLPGTISGSFNGHQSAGFNVQFLAEAVMDVGQHYQREMMLFVAPHDANYEWRSTRASSSK